jgi:small subunit ribosomal protein S20e
MAEFKEDLDKSAGQGVKTHKIRITLTSRNVKPLEKCKSSRYHQREMSIY